MICVTIVGNGNLIILMGMKNNFMLRKISIILCGCIIINNAFADTNVYTQRQLDDFIQKFSLKYKLPPEYIRDSLAKAKFQEDSYLSQMSYIQNKKKHIVKSWAKYRSQFLNPIMINNGVNFVCKNRQALKLAAKTYGVPEQVMVGIIGVETSYGGFTGNFRVLDAIATIAFNVERRRAFFQDELAQYLLMCYQYNLEPTNMKGSIDGGFGLSQFMPSSYMKFAVSGNSSTPPNLYIARDAILSVANYIKEHGWEKGQPVYLNVTRTIATCQNLKCNQMKPAYKLSIFKQNGVKFKSSVNLSQTGDLITLSDSYDKNAYIALHNYYVLFSYNHSLKYSMAVYQLGVAVIKQVEKSNCK